MRDREKQFKPLWRIHNRTYRTLMKGSRRARYRRYVGKLRSVLALVIRRGRRA